MTEPETVTRARDVVKYRTYGDPEGVIVGLLAAYDELVAEVERLRRWKGEAAEVLIGLQDLGRELNVPPRTANHGRGCRRGCEDHRRRA